VSICNQESPMMGTYAGVGTGPLDEPAEGDKYLIRLNTGGVSRWSES
jgi:hypothetical protein